jgi:hypothetical protein
MPSIHTALKSKMYIYYSTLDRFRELRFKYGVCVFTAKNNSTVNCNGTFKYQLTCNETSFCGKKTIYTNMAGGWKSKFALYLNS